MYPRCAGARLWKVRWAHRHRYAETLVAFQNNVDWGLEELFGARDRPCVRGIYSDLAQRKIVLEDKQRALLLFAYGMDGAATWRGVGPPSRVVYDFFVNILPKEGPIEELFVQMLDFAVYNGDAEIVTETVSLLLSTHPATKRLIYAALQGCFCIGGSEGATAAFTIIGLVKSHDIRLDLKMITLFLEAASGLGESGVDKAVSQLESIPQLAAKLHRMPGYYTAMLRGYGMVEGKAAFSLLGEMEEDGVVTLEHYAEMLDICRKMGDEKRGLGVMDDALSVSQGSTGEGDRFEAAELAFYTKFGHVEAAERSIRRSMSDRKHETSLGILISTLSHLTEYPESLDALPLPPVENHKQSAAWPELRDALLHLHAAAGNISEFEKILSEVHAGQQHTPTMLFMKEKPKYRELHTLAYIRAAERAVRAGDF